MNLNTGKRITRSKIMSVPLTEMVIRRVEDMAQQQLITHVKFTNKTGVTLPNVNWIAGVDYNDYENTNNGDEEYIPPEHEMILIYKQMKK